MMLLKSSNTSLHTDEVNKLCSFVQKFCRIFLLKSYWACVWKIHFEIESNLRIDGRNGTCVPIHEVLSV